MQLKNLFTDDDAVSPVIGVILMVAITVILAAVIGAFVLNLGGGQESPPQVDWGWEDEEGSNEVILSHNGGDRLDNPEQITVSLSNHSGGDNDVALDSITASFSSGDSAGAEGTISIGTDATGTAELVWESSDGSQSQVIDSHDYNTV